MILGLLFVPYKFIHRPITLLETSSMHPLLERERSKGFSLSYPYKCRKNHNCFQSTYIRGHPFMTSTKITFFTPSPVHMRPHGPDPSPLWTSTHGRHEIQSAVLKWLVQ